MVFTISITKIVVALLGASSVAQAHSWIEQLMVIAPNGTFVGEPGYPRGNILRSDKAFSDVPLVHLVTGVPADTMCNAAQKSPSYSDSSPALKAAPGANVALRFQENGHVTLPEAQLGKAKNRGDIYVYGTTEPKDNEMFNDIHGVWTADGKGGDGRGVLLVKADYDDGQCYQMNSGAISAARQKQFQHEIVPPANADLWCQTDLRIPSDLPTGKPYTLYWVWDWATAPNVDPNLEMGKNETYTSCMDIEVDSSAVDFSQKVASAGFIEGQPIHNAAVPAQFAKLGEQPAAPAASAPGAAPSAPAASAPGVAPPAPAASAPGVAPPAPASSAPAAASNSSAPAASSPTKILPIPGPSGPASSAPSVPLPAPPFPAPSGSSPTTILPIPGPAAPSAPPSAVTQVVQTIQATTMKTLTTYVTSLVTVSAAPAATAVAAPKIRGRNSIFRLGN
jgi:hypothetical protein